MHGSESHGGGILRRPPLSHLGPIQRLVLEAGLVPALPRVRAVTQLGLRRRGGRRGLGHLLWLGQGRGRLLPGPAARWRVVSQRLQLRDGRERGRVTGVAISAGGGGGRLQTRGMRSSLET